MKALVSVDVASGLAHTLVGTSGNVADVTQAHGLLHGDGVIALGSAGYQGVEKREENRRLDVKWYMALRPSKRKVLLKNKWGRLH
jgi:IS5 family transposase